MFANYLETMGSALFMNVFQITAAKKISTELKKHVEIHASHGSFKEKNNKNYKI